MAKKEATPNMVEQFAEFKELKNIDKTTMISVLEESFRNVLAKMFGTDENLDVILNPDKGDVQIFQNLTVVPDGEVQNPNLEIALSDAREDNDPDAEVGEEHTKEIVFEKFGRRAILNLRQTLQSKILDLQHEAVYEKFKDLEGELVSGEVYQTWSRETLLLDDEKNELLLPKSESIPGDFFRKGETVRAVIANVDNKNNNPKITVSRTNEQFLRRLFELEVPEIHDGLISIRAEARIQRYLDLGADRCILGTVAVKTFDFTAEMALKYGAQIAVGVDMKDGAVAVNGWKEVTPEPGVAFCRRCANAGVKAIIATDISRDGTMQGTNMALYRELLTIPGIEVTASGGIAAMAELAELSAMHCLAAILGKSIYTGASDLAEAVRRYESK